MAELEDVRRRNPVTDRVEYDRAYAQADLAGRLAEIVYRKRTAAGITQTEMARRMGTTQSAIARMEGGATTPTLDLLDRLGRAIDVEVVLAISDESIHLGAVPAA